MKLETRVFNVWYLDAVEENLKNRKDKITIRNLGNPHTALSIINFNLEKIRLSRG